MIRSPSSRHRKLRLSGRALITLAYYEGTTTLAQLAAGFRVSVGIAHAYVTAIVKILADKASGLLKTLIESGLEYVLVDGALAACDRVGSATAGGLSTPPSTRGTA